MIYGSVCSGIEAATAAWHPLGWQPSFFSEIEKFPCALLAHHHPATPNHGDMTRFQGWPDAALDVLVGGTPCQSFSVAGLRKGLDDPRGNLMLTYGAIAKRYRPTWLVWENVPGVLSSNGGRDFGTFLGMLGELGYGFACRILDAQFFGVAQRRRRVFVVGHLGDWRRAAAVLFERHSLQGHPAPRRETGEGSARGAARSVAIRGRDGVPQAELGDEVANAILTPNGGRGGVGVGATLCPTWPAEVASTLDTHYGDKMVLENQHINGGGRCSSLPPVSLCLNAGGMGRQDWESETLIPTGGCFDVAHTLRDDGFDASEDGTGRGTPLVPVAFTTEQTPKFNDDCALTLTKQSPTGGGQPQCVAFGWQNSSQQGASAGEHHTPTLDKSKTPAVSLGMAVRRLTPRECERLQGFPDDYTLLPGKAPDGPRYKALGNSMAVPVMAWIGRRIAQVAAINGSTTGGKSPP